MAVPNTRSAASRSTVTAISSAAATPRSRPARRRRRPPRVLVLTLILGVGAASLLLPHDEARTGFLAFGRRLGSDDDECSASDINNAEDKCAFVKDNCGDIAFLFNYLRWFYCTEFQAGVYVVLGLWLAQLIALLATTADVFFVPALEYLSFDLFQLSPEVAGITLLALGNGAPDVFGAMAGINGQNDFQVVLGALLGASLFISSVVLGAVLLTAEPQAKVDSSTFLRDILVYMLTVAVVIFISADGAINIFESLGLLGLYFCYVVLVVLSHGRADAQPQSDALQDSMLQSTSGRQIDHWKESLDRGEVTASNHEQSIAGSLIGANDEIGDDGPSSGCKGLGLGWDTPVGLAWPTFDDGDSTIDPDKHYVALPEGEQPQRHCVEATESPLAATATTLAATHTRTLGQCVAQSLWRSLAWAHWLTEMPIVIMRHLSCPWVDSEWDHSRRWIAVLSPLGFSQILVLEVLDIDGFSSSVGGLPIPVLALLLACPVSVAVCLATQGTVNVTDRRQLPRIYPALSVAAFASAVIWMDLLANETVALMESFGVILNISTAVLGLTVLALGNSVGDLIADLSVARSGHARMAVASCFGSPLLNDILGLGFALTITCVQDYPTPFHVSVNLALIIAWVFLAVGLVSNLVVFHVSGYKPPRKFAYFLIGLYLIFMVASVFSALT